jgi:hypothetical protein
MVPLPSLVELKTAVQQPSLTDPQSACREMLDT